MTVLTTWEGRAAKQVMPATANTELHCYP